MASPRAASPAASPSSSRATEGQCRSCGASVGEFFNAWHKITSPYHLPALVGSYSSQLAASGRQRRASNSSSELSGCQIDPLVCKTCGDQLGLQVIDATPEKKSFSGRDFFELSKINLRCEVAPDEITTVQPQVQSPDPSLLVLEDSSNPATPPPTMEVESRLPPMTGPHHQHHAHYDLHRASFESQRQALPPPPSSARSPPAPLALHPPTQKSPSNPPLPSPSLVAQPIHDAHYAPQLPKPSPKAASPNDLKRQSGMPPIVPHPHSHSHPHSPAEQRLNGHSYPRSPQEVHMDAIERLQTQISQNSSALVAQSRDVRRCEETLQHEGENLRRELQTQLHHQTGEIRRVDDAVARLQHEMSAIRELLEGLGREVHAVREIQARGGAAVPGHPISGQDSALELMAQQMAVMSHKANEVETLKITIEIMKNKIQRLEDAAAVAPPQMPPSQYASPREAPVRPAQIAHPSASYRAVPNQVPQIDIPVASAQRTHSYPSQGTQSVAVTPDTAQKPEIAAGQGGWVAVNAGVKRSHTNGVDSPQDSVCPSIGSPKRPKLAPIEPRGSYSDPQNQQHVYAYEHADTDESDGARMQTHRHTLPSTQNVQTGPPPPQATLPSQHHFIPYGSQEVPSDEGWRVESQRLPTEVRTPRSRGRGGGPGSRGGRVRKSMNAQYQHALSTPEWEREESLGVSESQMSPDIYYNVARGRGIIRRGSGGGGTSRGGRPGSSGGRSVSLSLQGTPVGATIGLPIDPYGPPSYAHTKKTRTKPIRNADGVLIRKDGRPDMRSQSSAANLRKVHARKEEEMRESEYGYTPTPSNLQHSTSMREAATPSPTSREPQTQDLTASQQKKHSHVMSKIFPGGVDEARKDQDYARKVFEEDSSHEPHSRTQHHHHTRDAHTNVKHEDSPNENVSGSYTPNSDVDMDRHEEQADDESQTPGGQSDNSGRESQYHDATEQESTPSHPQEQAQAEPTVNSS